MAIFYNTRYRLSISVFCFCMFISGYTLAAEHGHEACINCHVNENPGEAGADDALLLPPLELCLSCHMDRDTDQDHALGMEPGFDATGELPLIDGLISCTTCHDSHVITKGLLRLSHDGLCLACHQF